MPFVRYRIITQGPSRTGGLSWRRFPPLYYIQVRCRKTRNKESMEAPGTGAVRDAEAETA